MTQTVRFNPFQIALIAAAESENNELGCVVWMRYDPATLALGPFLWFGGKPHELLPSLGDKVARHTKANSQGVKAERPNIRRLARASFEKLPTMDAVAHSLFGIGNRS